MTRKSANLRTTNGRPYSDIRPQYVGACIARPKRVIVGADPYDRKRHKKTMSLRGIYA